jgi:hypothetical protein
MSFVLPLAGVLAISPPDPAATAAAEVHPATDESASTEAPARVVLLSGARAREPDLLARIRRTRAELDVAGFAVLEVTSTADGVPQAAADIDTWVAGTDARVVAVFDAERRRAEVWLRDESGALQRIAIVVGDVAAEDGDAVFAVRLAEVVRAVLIDVEPRAPPPPAKPPAPAPVAPPPPKEREPIRWAARVGAHGLASSGGLGFMIGPTLGGTVMLGARRRLGLDLELVASALEGRHTSSAGTARVGFGTARVHAGIWPWPRARVSPGFGIGMGVLLAWTRGDGEGEWIGRSEVTAVALPSAAVDLAIVLTPRLRLRFGARLGVALPAVRIHAPDGDVIAAQPLFDGGVALEVAG